MAIVMGRLPAAEKLPAQQLLVQEGLGWLPTAQQPVTGREEQRWSVAQPPPFQALGSVQHE